RLRPHSPDSARWSGRAGEVSSARHFPAQRSCEEDTLSTGAGRPRSFNAALRRLVWLVLLGMGPGSAFLSVPGAPPAHASPPEVIPLSACGQVTPIPLRGGGLMCTH